jgi:transcriptional regulator with XRE-family HTH domain
MPRSKRDPALSATIRRLRECKGMSREALAWSAGLTVGSLLSIELGRSGTSWSNFRGIARGLGVSITFLAATVEAAERTDRA